MNTLDSREILMRCLRDHDDAAKASMRVATLHLKRGYAIARELERLDGGKVRLKRKGAAA